MGLGLLEGDTADSGRDGVFVSYSHHDAVWAERFRKVLKPLIRSKRLRLWFDVDLRVGDMWRPELMQAIRRSSVALLLVSTDFLDSDFTRLIAVAPDPRKSGALGQGVPLPAADSLLSYDGALPAADSPLSYDGLLPSATSPLTYDTPLLPATSPLTYDAPLPPATSEMEYPATG